MFYSSTIYFLIGLRPIYYLIAAILCFHVSLSVVIQSLRLSFSPKLFVIILLKLLSMHSWRLPTGLGALNTQHFRIFLGFLLWSIFASFCSHLHRLISIIWCSERQFPSPSRTCLLVICCSITSKIVIPAILLRNLW